MNDRTLAEQLADFAAGAFSGELEPWILADVRGRVLDILGICAAATRLETSRSAARYVRDQGGHAQATAVGLEHRVTAAQAAFLNGVLAHSLDFDDIHLPSVLHPSAGVVPAALAAAEHAGSTGRQAVAAIAVGLEITVRLGMAGYDPQTKNSVFFHHGQHATSICGAMGGAVAAGLLYGLDRQGLVSALGVAASMAAGIIEANRTGGTVKRLHCGLAARAAVDAAQLVRHGITGPPTVLEGRFGFFQAWLHGQADAGAVTENLGRSWELRNIFYKPYPANHFTHTAIDAGRRLREAAIAPEDLLSVEIGAPEQDLPTIGQPIEIKRTPATGYMAQFSAPYAFVVGLLGGGGLGAAMSDFTDELAHDPIRRRLMALVDVVPDAECTAIFPHQFPVIVRARLRDGRTMRIKALTNRGGPQSPLSFEELKLKFADNVRESLSAQDAALLGSRTEQLSELTDVGQLLAPLRRAGALVRHQPVEQAGTPRFAETS